MEIGHPLYPVSLKLDGERCLVVGGGRLARHKTDDLLRCGALVHVVSPEWREEFPSDPALTRSTRGFEPADLDGVRVVVSATDDPAVQEVVAREASARGIPCNVVDVNRLCTFYVPAVLRRGSLTVSVATDGKFPLLAVALRDRFAAGLDPDMGRALDRLGEGRARAFARFPDDAPGRLAALERLLTPTALDLIVKGRLEEFETHWNTWNTRLDERG